MLKDPFAMPSRSPSSARSSRALYAPRLKPLAQAIALLLVAGGAQAAGQPFSAASYLVAGDKLELLAANDSSYYLYDKKSKGSFGSK
ncbi:hypothetical protein WA852_33205, partial [Pseudomonas aeruginosa]